jgi:hypothetical protein
MNRKINIIFYYFMQKAFEKVQSSDRSAYNKLSNDVRFLRYEIG